MDQRGGDTGGRGHKNGTRHFASSPHKPAALVAAELQQRADWIALIKYGRVSMLYAGLQQRASERMQLFVMSAKPISDNARIRFHEAA